MALTILDDTTSSDRSAHTARPVPGQKHAWEKSWLPSRHLNPSAGITAMILADFTNPGGIRTGHRPWIQIQGGAAGLGLTAPDALTRTANPPGWTDAGKNATPADLEAAE